MSKPVYTQAMVSHGITPLVGMEYLCGDSQLNTMIGMCGDIVIGHMVEHIGVNEYKALSQTHMSDIKPLTPPIELIDGEAYKYIAVDATIEKGIYYNGRMCNQHGQVQVKNCTNIQLLEVKS